MMMMNRMKFHEEDSETLDLSNRPQHLLSPAIGNEDDEETFTSEEDDNEHQQSMEEHIIGEHTDDGRETSTYDTKKTTYDSGFVDTSDENNDLGAMGNTSLVVKQERSRHHYHHHSTPLRPQQIHPHLRHPSTSSSTCSSTSHRRHSQQLEQRSDSPVDDKECRNTRFLGSRAVAVLNHWFQTNRDYPYPDDERTDRLANEAGITQKQVKKWFANKRVRSQMCYKPLYRSRKSRASSSLATTVAPVRSAQISAPAPPQPPIRRPQTNYNYIINHNNIATQPPSLLPDFGHLFGGSSPSTSNPALFNPMAASMMMFMMQQHFMTTMMAAAGLPQLPPPPPPAIPPMAPTTTTTTTTSGPQRKVSGDRITRFWL